MAKLFYLSEIIKFAIEKEKESEALYKKLATITNLKDIKKFFETLALEEKKHEKFYTQLLKTVPKEQSAGVKEDDEYAAYMKELIKSSKSVFLINFDATDIKTCLDYAINRERDSIIFYVGLKNYLPKSESEKINTIIAEESRHAAKLINLKKRF
jgi:rubrerythrin